MIRALRALLGSAPAPLCWNDPGAPRADKLGTNQFIKHSSAGFHPSAAAAETTQPLLGLVALFFVSLLGSQS